MRRDYSPVVSVERRQPRLAHRDPDPTVVTLVDRDVDDVVVRETVLARRVGAPRSAREEGDSALPADPHAARRPRCDGDRLDCVPRERDFGSRDGHPLSSGSSRETVARADPDVLAWAREWIGRDARDGGVRETVRLVHVLEAPVFDQPDAPAVRTDGERSLRELREGGHPFGFRPLGERNALKGVTVVHGEPLLRTYPEASVRVERLRGDAVLGEPVLVAEDAERRLGVDDDVDLLCQRANEGRSLSSVGRRGDGSAERNGEGCVARWAEHARRRCSHRDLSVYPSAGHCMRRRAIAAIDS